MKFSPKLITVLIITSIFSFSWSCGNKSKKNINLSKVDIEGFIVKRYEEELFSLNKDDLLKEMSSIRQEYPVMMGEEDLDSGSYYQMLDYLSDPNIIALFKKSQEKFSDLTKLTYEIKKLLKYLKFYYPEISINAVYTYISGLDVEYPIKLSNHAIIIALDLYLGSDYDSYKQFGLPSFKTRWFNDQSIIVDIATEYAHKFSANKTIDGTLMDQMVYLGKIQYFVDALLPDVADSIKFKYTSAHMKWAVQNEANVWSYFVENNLLFSTEMSKIRKFTDDAPFSTAFSQEAPPRLGQFIGWKIVNEYVEKSGIGLIELMKETDSQRILKESRYKPKK